MKAFTWTLAAAVALLVFAGTSEAGHCNSGSRYSFSFGIQSPGYYGGGGYGNYYSTPSYGHYNNSYYQPRVWHDTSHYDYHAPTVVPHGNHFPGHYDWHQTGHWHN